MSPVKSNVEPLNVKLDSTVPFGELPLSVIIPLSVVPANVIKPDVPVVPAEPEVPAVP